MYTNGQWSLMALAVELFEVGSYGKSGLERPASYRGNSSPSNDNDGYVGLRVTLYLL